MARGLPVDLVYVIGSHDHRHVKIGHSTDVPARRDALQTGSPFRLEVLLTVMGGERLEGALHARFREERREGEWFDFGGRDPVEAVRRAVVELGCPAEEVPPIDEPLLEDLGPADTPQGIEYSRYPADDDPDRDNPDYAPFHPAGCRYLTPTENASWGYPPDSDVFWKLCLSFLADH